MKLGVQVVGKVLFGDGSLVTGVIVATDAEISRDAVVVELSNGDRCVMLESTISPKECKT